MSEKITRFCIQCGKEIVHSGTKFCCRSCFATYNNIHRKNKTKGKTKIINCSICGKQLIRSVHSSSLRCKCSECQNKKKIFKFRHIKDIQKNIEYNNTCLYSTNKNFLKSCNECFFFKNEICKGQSAGMTHIINNLSSVNLFNFDKSTIGTNKLADEFLRIKQLLYDMYYVKNLSGLEIDKLAGKHIWQSIGKRTFKLNSRTHHDALIVALEQGRTNLYSGNKSCCYKSEWYTTWDNNEVYLRSSYEVDYAKQLDCNKVHYEVETLRIKYFDTQMNEYRCAIPDFYIPSTNTIVEIKSTYTLDLQNMKDKFKAYQDLGYNTKLILDHRETNLI